MKVDLDILSSVQRKVRVELPSEVVADEFLRAYERLGQRARIKGFRPGRAPRSVLQGLYGDEVRREVLTRLVERSLHEVFAQHGLQVVSRPQIEADGLEEGRAWRFSALFEVKPEIEVKNYLGVELEKVRLEPDGAQVEAALNRLQEAHAHLQPVEERDVVERGDFVVLDFVGSMDGKPFAEGKGENYLLEVGAGRALPQFEEAVIGLKKSEEHAVTVAYPEGYLNRRLAGKVAVFRVMVQEIKKKILPPLDDEFAKDHGECANLEELKAKIRARLEGELSKIQDRELKEQLLTRLIEAHPFESPSALVEEQLRYLVERHRDRLAAQGPSPSGEGPSREELQKELGPHALRQVKARLLVERIAALEKIEVSDPEVGQRIEEILRSARDDGEALREFYRREEAREDLRSQMVFERTLDYLVERARVKEVERSATKAST